MESFVDPRNSRPPVADSSVPTRLPGSSSPPGPPGPPGPPEGGWSAWYLRDEDDVGESTEQGITVRTLLAALSELARERGWARTLVAGDQFFAWVESEPLVRISPDVYLLDDPPLPPYPGMWRTWLPGQAPPRFAVEVVSDDWAKDYLHAPRKYDQLGTRELVVFDPEAALAPRSRRIVLQMFRRDPDGALVRVDAGQGPFYSVELDAWLVVQRNPGGARLRIARDREGRDLVATAEELVAGLRSENLSLQARVTTLEAQVAELQAVIALQKDLIAQQAHELAETRRQLAERDAVIAEQTARMAERDAHIAEQAARMAERDAHIARVEAALRERDVHIARVEATLRERDVHIAERDASIARLEATLRERDAHIAERDASIARLEATLREQTTRLLERDAAIAERDATIARLEAGIVERDRRHDALQDRVGALEAALARLLDGR
jgi:Uma2 family endonuclease/peptidoglycan hydrolase CwlO-like protein